MFPFARSVWTTTDGTDETNHCVLATLPAHQVASFVIELQLDVEALGAMQVTPHAQVSNDGKTWDDVSWVGDAPTAITDNALTVLGPFEIDQSHGRRQLRLCLKTEMESGTAMVFGHARGRVTTFSRARQDPWADLRAVKTEHTERTSTTTLIDDPDLSLPVEANAHYAVDVGLFAQGETTTPDLKIAFSQPSGAAGQYAILDRNTNLTGMATASTIALDLSGEVARITGTLQVGPNAGDFALQWAQNTASADWTRMRDGSWMLLKRLS